MLEETPANKSASNRRDFLTGRSVHKALQARGEDLANAIQEASAQLAPVAQETVRLETRSMGCQWAVVMNPGPPRQVMCASDALDHVYRVEDLLTVYRDNSETALLNHRATFGPTAVSSDLYAFLKLCRHWWKETEGCFDPAAGRMIELWKRVRDEGNIPSQAEIDQVLKACGFQHVHLDDALETVAFESRDLKLDFGAIGKGLAVDFATSHMRTEQIENFLIHGGQSSMYAAGQHFPHDGWPVGIRNPLFTEERYATILLKNEAISTSGSNVQFFRHGGQRYGHILDPRTGWPAAGLLSVTVIAATAAVAEALSTAFYVWGLDKAVAYCENHSEVGAILVPPPRQGRVLEPVVCNFPNERLFIEKSPILPASDFPKI